MAVELAGNCVRVGGRVGATTPEALVVDARVQAINAIFGNLRGWSACRGRDGVPWGYPSLFLAQTNLRPAQRDFKASAVNALDDQNRGFRYAAADI